MAFGLHIGGTVFNFQKWNYLNTDCMKIWLRNQEQQYEKNK
jgi:hypothetical protein